MAKRIRRKPAPAQETKTKPKTTGKSRTARTKAEAVTAQAPRQKDEFGFMEGTDSSIAAHALAKGGDDRVAIYEQIREDIESHTGLQTRNGTEKNIPNLVATVLKQMRNRGYIVESTWRVVKDPNFVEPEVIESDEDEIVDQADIEDAKADEEVQEPAEEPKAAPKKRRTVRRGSRLG